MGCCMGKSDAEELQPAFDPVIGLSDSFKASSVTVDGVMISGSGSIFGDSPVLQDKCYFEATIRSPGSFAIGVATKHTPLDGVLSQEKAATAWTLTNSCKGVPELKSGDTIGCALDQGDYPVQVYFYHGGKVIHQISGIRGEVMPLFSVDDGAVLEANFGGKEYAQGMPAGFQGIIKSMSLL